MTHGDSGDDERYALPSDAERTVAYICVIDGLIRGDGLQRPKLTVHCGRAVNQPVTQLERPLSGRRAP
jgi:hypothetical protein